MTKTLTRRRFVQGAAALAASLAVPITLPERALTQTLVESVPVEPPTFEEYIESLPAYEGTLDGFFEPALPDTEAPLHLFNERGELIGVSWFATLEAFSNQIEETPFGSTYRRYVQLEPDYRLLFRSEISFDPLAIATVLIQDAHHSISGRFMATSWNLTGDGYTKWPLECSGCLRDVMAVT